jgi:hypothetical protein
MKSNFCKSVVGKLPTAAGWQPALPRSHQCIQFLLDNAAAITVISTP